MGDPVRNIEAQALRLPPKERARLAQCLIVTLDPESDREAAQISIEEGERRLDGVESSRIVGISAEQVFEKTRTTHR